MMMKTVAVFSMIISAIFSCDKSVMTDDLRGVELSKSKEEETVRISQMYRVERARWSAGRELMNSEIVRLKDELQQKTAELDAGRSNVEQAMRHSKEQYDRNQKLKMDAGTLRQTMDRLASCELTLSQISAENRHWQSQIADVNNVNQRLQQTIQEGFGINQQLKQERVQDAAEIVRLEQQLQQERVQAAAEIERLKSTIMDSLVRAHTERSLAAAAMADSVQHQQTIQLMIKQIQALQPVQQASFAHPMPVQQQGEPLMATPVPPSPPPTDGYNTGCDCGHTQNPFAYV